MIRVKYEKYRNDFDRKIEERTFSSLQELQDWLFDNCNGRYEDKMCFIDPDSRIPYYGGKLHLDGSCISMRGDPYDIWILWIVEDGRIIYSTGRFTNGISHWNEEVKQWLRECRNRQVNPIFNFG